MFIGNKEVQQGAVQKLMEAVVHLRRANDALMTVMPITADLRDGNRMRDTKKLLVQEANYFEEMYLSAAREAFSE